MLTNLPVPCVSYPLPDLGNAHVSCVKRASIVARALAITHPYTRRSPMRAINLVGRVFGRLTVLSFVESRPDIGGHARRIYLVRCECGTQKTVPSGSLLSGSVV
jgi:hypothetical protein